MRCARRHRRTTSHGARARFDEGRWLRDGGADSPALAPCVRSTSVHAVRSRPGPRFAALRAVRPGRCWYPRRPLNHVACQRPNIVRGVIAGDQEFHLSGNGRNRDTARPVFGQSGHPHLPGSCRMIAKVACKRILKTANQHIGHRRADVRNSDSLNALSSETRGRLNDGTRKLGTRKRGYFAFFDRGLALGLFAVAGAAVLDCPTRAGGVRFAAAVPFRSAVGAAVTAAPDAAVALTHRTPTVLRLSATNQPRPSNHPSQRAPIRVARQPCIAGQTATPICRRQHCHSATIKHVIEWSLFVHFMGLRR